MFHNQTLTKLHDGQLWDSIRKGNRDCLATLFNRYYTRLFNYGFKIVAREEFVKDCIQELFLNIWEQRETVSSVQSVSSYLHVSMRRMIFYNLRKFKNIKKRNTTYVKEFTEVTHNIESVIIRNELDVECRRHLNKAMQDLSNRQKEIIRLKYTEGLSNSEIARLLDIKRQSVYNHVSEALKFLKTYVSGDSATSYAETRHAI